MLGRTIYLEEIREFGRSLDDQLPDSDLFRVEAISDDL